MMASFKTVILALFLAGDYNHFSDFLGFIEI